MISELWTGKDVKYVVIASFNFLAFAMKNLEYVSGLRFEPGISQTWSIRANHDFSF